ncbi:MAG: B12-binding domain-containing radical SAM protein, partial [Clostridia bacterium]|nr:B12-binding domain-containing radical SAM protein [Clostridia bacterium]
MKIVIACLNSKFVHASLSPWCLLAGLRAFSETPYEAVVAESTINGNLEMFARDILAQNPDVVALSCYIWNITQTLDVCRILKE